MSGLYLLAGLGFFAFALGCLGLAWRLSQRAEGLLDRARAELATAQEHLNEARALVNGGAS